MTRDHYDPVPLDLDAAHARWSTRPGYLEAYDALADEFAALNELLRARKAAGMTQADVAERMGIAQASVARLEVSAGSRKHAPSVATLRRYADAVNCDLRITLTPSTPGEQTGVAKPARRATRKPPRSLRGRKARSARAARKATSKRAAKSARKATSKRAAKSARKATAKRAKETKRYPSKVSDATQRARA